MPGHPPVIFVPRMNLRARATHLSNQHLSCVDISVWQTGCS